MARRLKFVSINLIKSGIETKMLRWKHVANRILLWASHWISSGDELETAKHFEGVTKIE